MEKYAPIALFVYNRPQHTLKTIEALKANKLANETKLFIYSDAAKTPEQEDNVTAVREIVASVTGFKSVSVMKAKTNFGLAQAIIFGVTDLLRQYERVIVFEDDLLSSPYTLKYFNDALKHYETEEKVMHISGYMYPLAGADKLPDTFLYRAAHSWGWATWERAWVNFNPDIDDLLYYKLRQS
jgi:GT2 family glycosyltransferase